MGTGYFDLFDKVGPLCTVFETAERFHPRGQQLYKFTGTKESSYIRKRFSSHRSEDWFEKPTWPLFHCFGTPIWPSWRHENALLLVRTWRHGGHVGGQEQKHFAPLGTKLCCHVNSLKKNLLYWPPTWPPCYMVVIQEYNLLVFSPWFPPTYCDCRSSLKVDNIITDKTGLSLWLLKKSSLGFSVTRYHKTGLEHSDQADLKTQENNTWESLKGFMGYGISFTWSPGFGILKRNGGGIRDWNQHGIRDAKITIGITGLSKTLGRDDKVEKGARRSSCFRMLRQIRSMSIRHRHCFLFVAIETDWKDVPQRG